VVIIHGGWGVQKVQIWSGAWKRQHEDGVAHPSQRL
jgi:hypothetical protein